jgi:hypothetical protein
MAQTLETLRSNNVTPIYGRRLGLQYDETLAGPKDIKRVVQDLTTASTGTTLNAYGIITAAVGGTATTAAGGVFILPNPIPGVPIDILRVGTSQAATAGSTAVAFLRGSTAFYIESSLGTTGVALLLANGAGTRLIGVTTAKYVLQPGSVGVTVIGAS